MLVPICNECFVLSECRAFLINLKAVKPQFLSVDLYLLDDFTSDDIPGCQIVPLIVIQSNQLVINSFESKVALPSFDSKEFDGISVRERKHADSLEVTLISDSVLLLVISKHVRPASEDVFQKESSLDFDAVFVVFAVEVYECIEILNINSRLF
jgi:hypothetical protein